MKAEELGFRFEPRPKPQTGKSAVHYDDLTELEQNTIEAIKVHNQRPADPAIPADFLARWLDIPERDVRYVVNHLLDRRYHGLPIFYRAGLHGGYFLGTENEQLREWAKNAVQTHMRRAITGLKKARDMGASAAELAEGMVQLTLDLNQKQAQELGVDVIDSLAQAGIPISHQAVESALARYAKNPKQYQKEIHQLARQYGGLFVRREQLAAVLKEKAGALVEAAMAELGGKEAISEQPAS